MKIEEGYDVDRLTDELGVNDDAELHATSNNDDEDYEFPNRAVNFDFEEAESEYDDADFDDEESDYLSPVSNFDDEPRQPYGRWQNERQSRSLRSKQRSQHYRWHFDDDDDDLW